LYKYDIVAHCLVENLKSFGNIIKSGVVVIERKMHNTHGNSG